MAIIQTIDLHQFREAFRAYNRLDQFSWEGLELIFDELESISDDTGTDWELDVIAICCDYTEDMPESIAQDYRINTDELDDGEIIEAVMEYLSDNTTVVGQTSSGAIIYVNF